MSNQPIPEGDPLTEFTAEELAQAKEALSQLTPADYLSLNGLLAQYQTQLSKTAFAEAPCILWMDLSTPDGDIVNFTVRAHLPEEVFEAFARGLKLAKRRYGLIGRQKRNNQNRADAPAPTPAPVPVQAQPPQPVQPQPTRVPVASPADPGATPDSRGHFPGQVFMEDLAHLEVTPQAGGGVKVGFVPFMRNGRPGQYATAYEQLKTPAEWAQIFTGFQAEVVPGQWRTLIEGDFKVAGKYNFPAETVEVEFIVSDRLNSKSNYFVNLKRVLPK